MNLAVQLSINLVVIINYKGQFSFQLITSAISYFTVMHAMRS